MNINDLTIGQATELAAMLTSPHVGRESVIRTYASGVHFGTLVAHTGRQVELANARRLWKWCAIDGISLSEVAKNGIDTSKSWVCTPVESITILDALEIIPTTDAAAESITLAETYKP
jgi:hypothetical protein